ncbi:MAG: PolC-type DNA polymerase III [Lachnospiraceae bacterium]|nr:PolC-type DNA polymerase III [Lachnospiraceae bacterium]
MKPFFEAFPTLQLKNSIAEQMEDIQVTRVGTNHDNSLLRVYIESTRPLERQMLHNVEYEINKQILKTLYPGTNAKVSIQEHYHLKDGYSLSSLMDTYWESILLELKEFDRVLYQILNRAEVSYTDNVMRLVLEDTIVARAKSHELVDILDKILNERCGMGADIRVEYKEASVSKAKESAERMMEEEIRRITLQRENSSGEVSDQNDPGSEQAGDETADIKANTKTNTNSKIKGRNLTTQLKGKRASRPQNPDVIYGRDFDDPSIPVSDIIEGIGEVTVTGEVIAFESRELRNERKLVTFDVTDYTDTIRVKIFPKEEEQDSLFTNVKTGAFITLKAQASVDKFDGELSLGYVKGIKKAADFRNVRIDSEPEKRVELHCHTKMSDMDGVSDVVDLMKRAAQWGHPAIAITDHGVVQSFTDAFHALPKIRKEHPDFKLIYGMEGYLVDDLHDLVTNPVDYDLKDTFVVFDIETTGFSATDHRIIEIGAVKIKNREITDTFSSFINPKTAIPHRITELTGITDEMVADAPFLSEVLPEFLSFAKDAVLVAHNANFDMSFIIQKGLELGIEETYTYIDTVGMAKVLLTNIAKFTLDNVAKHLKIKLDNHHRAVDDAKCTAEIFIRFLQMLEKEGVTDLYGLNKLGNTSSDRIKKTHPYHVILLAKNDIGRINLYRLVSESHLKYSYGGKPKIPKSLLQNCREGLLIGSACEQGEVFRAILEEKPKTEIEKIVAFYDYLEVQPIGNNAFLKTEMRKLDGGRFEKRYEHINTDADLEELNLRIVKLGEKYHKPVVATCDVHFMDPQDEIYRRIVQSGQGFDDADHQAPLFLRTTQEMMEEFSYLPYEKAYEIVVTNTRLIADMIEYIEPVRPDKCPPVIEHSDETLREICYKRAHEIYGEKLPEQVSARLERELHSIISNGFAVMYIIAQKLVWKSLEDGYLVGSRGSVGSSFVATMAGITEVNPLPAHYYCSKCHYVDFDSDAVKANEGKAGCDLPDAVCPVCGEKLHKDGFDIPFETFLGFKGDKEPDIDLNFSGEYQAIAHKYTEEIFGKGQTFKAGTISTLADKTAYGFVKKYYEEHHLIKRPCEINRLSQGIAGIRKTTGQHPGGIIVLPHGEDINSFTPIQHPADKAEGNIITTHFDYHSIDHNLLKLDILGHDDPTMIRRLADLTGTDPREVPLDDPKVMSLFQNTSALGISPEEIGGCLLGSLGIPEFGTDFAMQMLLDTKPSSFSDLVRIAGLAHGTDVWLGNARDLILGGTATISTAICTRDDIMTYLIGKGLDPALSFNIMEAVRKGKVAKKDCPKWNEWKAEMEKHDVPDWYIASCEKIAYMFPKAHAAAYVMMAWRIAYYKIYYPLAYYAAYLSIRTDAFDYEKMCQGKEKLASYLSDYRKRSDSLEKKEQDELKDMRVVEEMYARGFSFMPIDIFRAKAHACQIIDGKIMPHIGSINGMGDKAADAVVEACKDGPFLSKDDFRERTRITKTSIEKMAELGLLGNIPESNQLSLFDSM